VADRKETVDSKNQAVRDQTRPARRRRAHFRAESGQSLVEVALLTPFMLLLLLGAIEIGRFAYQAIRLGNAARAGVEYGAQTHWTAGDAIGIAAAACQDFQGQNTCGLTITKAYLCQCDNAGTIGPGTVTCNCPLGSRPVVSLQVTTSGTFGSLFNYPGIPPSMTISRTATMRLWQ
jgi:Flp pilus assembly protein TadG